jgi:small subunit ribosomal protein S8
MINKGYNFNYLVASLVQSINRGILNKQRLITHVKSKYIVSILNSFFRGGFIVNFRVVENIVIIKLKYDYYGNSLLSRIDLCSKPGLSQHKGVSFLKKLVNKEVSKYYFLTTNQGVLSNKEAIVNNIGGKLICCVYC